MECDGGDTYLFSSVNGADWSLVTGGPILECGAAGAGDGGYIIAGIHLLEYPNDKWGLPYKGHAIPHKYPGRDMNTRKGLFPGVRDVPGIAMWTREELLLWNALKKEDSPLWEFFLRLTGSG